MRYLVFIIALFAAVQTNAQNNIVYGAGINYTNGAPTFTPPVRTSRVAIDTVTGKWYHFNTPGGWQLIGNTIEEIAGCTAPAYTPGKGDSKIVINNCSPQPELYFYNGSAWVLVGGGSVYAGEGIRIENDTIILDSLNFLDFRTGSALDGDVGRVQWNDIDGTLDLNLKGGNVTLQIGQEEVSLVKHADNLGLIEGRVVYIVGSDGANKTVRYAKADSDATSATTFGLMTESASGGNKAFCTTFGLVRNLNTTNLTEGGIVWLSADTAGTMTAVRPTAPEHGVMIGFCVRKHATQGAIFVQVQNGYELNELHDVFVPSPTNGQVLTWNSTNARWEAITPANQLQTLSTDSTPGNISISSGNTITLNVNDADASATNELQTLSVAANTATLSNSGGSVTIAGAGINTVGTAGTTITVTGTEIDGSTTNELQTLSLSGSDLSISGGNTVTLPAGGITGTGANTQVAYFTGTTTQASEDGLVYNATNNVLGINMGATSPSGANLIIKNSQEPTQTTVVATQTFSADTTNWTRGAGWTFNGTQAVATLASGALTYTPALTITNGNWYEVTYTIGSYTAGTLNINIGNSSVTVPVLVVNNNKLILKPSSAAGGFRFTTSGFTGTLDNVTVIEIANPAPVLFGAQDDNGTNIYLPLSAPSINSFAFGGGLRYATGTQNTGFGQNALTNITSGTSNTGIGTNALLNNTTGNNNTAIGIGALLNNTIGGANVGIGPDALSANRIGSSNFALGLQTLQNNTSGSRNVGIGIQVLQNNITGGVNTAIGDQALRFNTGNENVAIGASALEQKRSGNSNTAIGYYAGYNTVVADSLTGGNNTIMGAGAARNIVGSASRNLVIGNGINLPVSNGNDQINIKNIIFGTGASGTGTTIAGNIGIGLTAPAARLHVVGSGTSSSTWTAQFHNSAGNNNALMIRDDGNVGIGTSSPGARLQIDGSGNTSATISLTVRNSDGTSLLRVRDDLYTSINYLRVGNSFTTSTLIFPFVTNSGVPDAAGTNLSFYNYTGSNSAVNGAFAFAGNNFTQTSGNHVFFRFGHNFVPTSGNATYSAFTVRPTINQTGGSNGITRGFHIDPLLTSAVDWRSIEWSNNSGWGLYGAGSAKSYFAGNVAIGTTTQNASAAFEVASTTQGILFPRMTTTERNAIATPADGLVIYNTTDNKLQVRAAGAWVDLH